MNKKKITSILLSGAMTVGMTTSSLPVFAQEETEINSSSTVEGAINQEQDNVLDEKKTQVIVNETNTIEDETADTNASTEIQKKESIQTNDVVETQNKETITTINNLITPLSNTSNQTDSSVAQVEMNGTVSYYDNLNEAVHAISDANGTGTIALLKDASLTGWAADKIVGNITLIGNNHSVSGDGAGISVYGTLTIQNCNFASGATLCPFNLGTINIYGGNHETITAGYGGIVNVYDGNFGMAYVQEGTLNIYGGTFVGVDGNAHLIPKSINMPASLTMKIDSTFDVTFNRSIVIGGNPVNIIPQLSSSDPNVVSVDRFGTLTAEGEGTATITASTYGFNPMTCTVTVTKKTLEAPDLSSLVAVYIDNDSMTLDCARIASVENLQYAYAEGDHATAPTDESAWKDVTKDSNYLIALTNLKEATPYTIFLRYKETNEYAASPSSSEVFTTTQSSVQATINYVNETIHVRNAYSDYRVILGNESTIFRSDGEGNIPIQKDWFGKTITILLAESPSSLAQKLDVPARPAAPLSLEGEVAGTGENDCKITGLNNNVSYEISKDDGETWDDATVVNGEITGLSVGTYQVRFKATDTTFASQPVTVAIEKIQTELKFTVDNIDKVYDGITVNPSTHQSNGGGISRTLSWYQLNEDGSYTKLEKAPINAGSYKVVATIKESANYTGAKIEMTFEIFKATPSYTLPTGLTMKQGETLSSVALPKGFTWKDENQKADALGTQTFKAVFTPEDTTNYEVVKDIEISVTVNPKMEVINQPPVINAKDQTLTVGDEFDPLKGITATDVEDGDLTDKIKVTKNTVDTSKEGKYRVDYEVKDSGGIRVVRTITVTVKEKSANQTTTDSKKTNGANTSVGLGTGLFASLAGVSALGAGILSVLKKRNSK